MSDKEDAERQAERIRAYYAAHGGGVVVTVEWTPAHRTRAGFWSPVIKTPIYVPKRPVRKGRP